MASRGVRNILFVMCDQLRADHLSCYGHPHLHTPNLDALAARGLRFSRAYVQSPVCGPSRMSFYTGRYVQAHGCSWNMVPLAVGAMTIGDHLRPLGVRSVLVGKTHMRADYPGMARLGIDPQSEIGVRVAECGFEPWERDDGLHPSSGHDPEPPYNAYLRDNGFGGANPWEDWANAAEGEDGTLLSGWFLKHSARPARVPDEHSETPYLTRRAIACIDELEAEGRPWVLHLSYIATTAEQGLPDIVMEDWVGFLARSGTPEAVVARLGAAVERVLANPATQAQIRRLGVEPATMTPDAFTRFVSADVALWGGVVRDRGIRIPR
jgi:hypothetical protein